MIRREEEEWNRWRIERKEKKRKWGRKGVIVKERRGGGTNTKSIIWTAVPTALSFRKGRLAGKGWGNGLEKGR